MFRDNQCILIIDDRYFVLIVFQYVEDGSVSDAGSLACPSAGSLQPIFAILITQPQHTQTAIIGLFYKSPGLEQKLNGLAGMFPDHTGPSGKVLVGPAPLLFISAM
jgi:hypothetical protein